MHQTWRDKHNFIHRDGGPAIIYSDGTEEWFQHGKIHRDDGPAVIYASGDTEWWLWNSKCNDINEWAKRIGIYDTEEFLMMKLQWG